MSTTPLPPLHARWVEGALGRPLPAEGRATCDDCAMATRDGKAPLSAERAYHPAVKCCTYLPFLPNFNIGAILADEALPEGRALVAERVRGRLGATPRGMGPSPEWRRTYDDAVARDEFGRRIDLTCPYYDGRDGGRCSIWRHRESVCATYFCKYERGAAGMNSWRLVRAMIQVAEHALATHCLHELGLPAAALAELHDPEGAPRGPADLRGYVHPDGRLAEDLARRLWGPWFGREEAFYRACAELVTPLSWGEVRAIGGVDLRIAEERARATRPTALPPVLVVGTVEGMAIGGGLATVRSSEMVNDWLRMPEELWELLPGCDGATPEEVMARLDIDRDDLDLFIERAILLEPDGRDLLPGADDGRPLEPEDRLCVFRGHQQLDVYSGERGDDGFALAVGANGIIFEDEAWVALARRLVERQNGFRAGEAMAWSGRDWEAVRRLLENLIADRILQRVVG